jgi:hypothetical protein
MPTSFHVLPDTRHDVVGVDSDGHRLRLTRDIARKLYRCPGCHGDIAIGDEHVVVIQSEPQDGYDHHHWHTRCTEEILLPDLRRGQRVSARRGRA